MNPRTLLLALGLALTATAPASGDHPTPTPQALESLSARQALAEKLQCGWRSFSTRFLLGLPAAA